MTPTRAPLILLLAAVLGCPAGTMAKNFQPAQEPRGIQADVRLPGSTKPLPVELLALQDTALIAVWRPAAAPAQLVIIPLRSIEHVRCPAISQSSFVKDGAYTSPELRARFALLARYPQGVSPELMTLLLGDYGQTVPARLR